MNEETWEAVKILMSGIAMVLLANAVIAGEATFEIIALDCAPVPPSLEQSL